ncbi:Vgb family protein [Chryseobacterium schmidteae]|uniref:Vgb family protein n=1 Tax=Chryseobacterium schmidteae TaxID=2730404 RepID=UPI00158C8620|nr:T9SS type A sorting domain-containing protein [Chryseobacterium schmidteae]
MHRQIYLLVAFFLLLGSKTYSQTSISVFQDNLTTPNPMITDGNDLYVGYYYSDKVVKFDLTNPNTPPVDIATGVNRPYGLAIKDNTLYISEFGGDKISKIDLSNTGIAPETVISNVNSPIGLEFIGNDLYIALEGENRVIKIDVTQASPQPTTVTNALSPFEIEFVGDQLYISERFEGRIVRFDMNNSSAASEVVAQGLSYPSGLASHGKQLFIAEAGASKISKISTSVTNPTVSDAVTSSLLSYPSGLLMRDNIMYITDFFANAIFKVDLASLSVSEFSSTVQKNIKVYPNPATDKLNVYNAPSKEYKIFDMTGRVINSGTLERNSINVSQLSSGNYILKTGEATTKFIKK